jgi:hypothetical protein
METQTEIHITKEELARLVHLGSTTKFADMESSEDARKCRLLGLFFALNGDLAAFAVDIDEITLTPRGEWEGGVAPLARVTITRRQRTYYLVTASNGVLPSLPFGTRRRFALLKKEGKKRKKGKKRWKKRSL